MASITWYQIKQSKLCFEISEFMNLWVSSSILPWQHWIRHLLLLPRRSPVLASSNYEQQSPLVFRSLQLEYTQRAQSLENLAVKSTNPSSSEMPRCLGWVRYSLSASVMDIFGEKGPQGPEEGTKAVLHKGGGGEVGEGKQRPSRSREDSKARTHSLGHLLMNSLTQSFNEEGKFLLWSFKRHRAE